MGVEVAILATWTHLCEVPGSSASVRMSSNVSLLTVRGLPRSGAWPVLVPAPQTVLTVLGSWSITSHLSLAKSQGGEAWGDSWWGLSVEDLKIAWCSTNRALSLLNSFSCSFTLSIAWSCIFERAATCTLWACSSSIICYMLSCLASNNWAISRASSTATCWCIKLSWWAQAHWTFCSTLVSVSLRKKDLKTSLQADKLNTSSSDAILINYQFR